MGKHVNKKNVKMFKECYTYTAYTVSPLNMLLRRRSLPITFDCFVRECQMLNNTTTMKNATGTEKIFN